MFMSTIRSAGRSVAVVAVLGLVAAASQQAWGKVYAYPMKNQSAQQQQKDEGECDAWATQQTGFDPRRPPQFHGSGGDYGGPSGSVQSGIFGRGQYGEGGGIADAGKGALGGLLIGGIAGDAGKGAAIGSLSGLFLGAVKRSSAESEREAWHAQHQQQQAAARAQYNQQIQQMQGEHDRAFGACMSGRGYRIN